MSLLLNFLFLKFLCMSTTLQRKTRSWFLPCSLLALVCAIVAVLILPTELTALLQNTVPRINNPFRLATTMAQPAAKKQRTHPTYELLYHPTIPGRGEFVRLLLEGAGAAYKDLSRDEKDGYSTVQQICMNKDLQSDDGNPPLFAPPALRVPGAGKDGKSLVISQTPNIMAYLGEQTGMDGGEEKWHVAQVALTALDLNNEVHDTHHPVAVMKWVMFGSDGLENVADLSADTTKSRRKNR